MQVTGIVMKHMSRARAAVNLLNTIPRCPTVVQARFSSHSPLGSSTATLRKKVTLQTLAMMYKRKEPITMITAHDFPSAHVADHAGMDMVLVGDSLAMVALGMDDTSEVTLEEMILHCRSVSRGAKSAFIVSHHSADSKQRAHIVTGRGSAYGQL